MKRSGPLRRGKPLARGKPLRQRSERKAASDLVYEAARTERMMQAGGWCEGATPACPDGRHPGVLAHHVRRRKGQPDVHAVEGLRWCCAPAHEWIHANPAAAKEEGLLA